MLRYVTYDSRYLLYQLRPQSEDSAKWVCMLRFWSHLSVQGYCSLSPNKADAGFPAETTILFSEEFSFWGVDDKVLRISSPCYRCTTAVAKFAAVTAIFLLLSEIREGGGLKETFLKTATLSVLVWAYPREMKPNNENFKIAAVLPRWCYYGNIDVPIPLRIWNFSCVTSMRTYFAAVSWESIMGCFCVVQLLLLY